MFVIAAWVVERAWNLTSPQWMSVARTLPKEQKAHMPERCSPTILI